MTPYQAMLRCSEKAGRGRRYQLLLADHKVEFWVRDEALEILLGPFEHLLVPPCDRQPRLRVDVWSEVSPPTLCQPPAPGSRWDREFGQLLTPLDALVMGWRRPDMLCWFDRRRGHLLAYVPRPDRLDSYALGKPFLLGLISWLRSEQLQPVHGALLARGGQGVLVVGPPSSGKSTLALAGYQNGWKYLGDDYLVFAGATGYSLYRSLWLDSAFLSRWPRLPPASASHQSKSLVLLEAVPRVEVKTVVEVRPGSANRLSVVSPATALKALAPGSLTRLPASRPQDLQTLARLTSGSKCLLLEYAIAQEGCFEECVELLEAQL